MTAELALRPGASLPDKITYARALADAGLLPSQYRQQPANVLFAMEYAEALGLPTISAITSVHVIDGKPSASADLIAMLVRRAGHKLRVTGDEKAALAQVIRADDPDFTFESKWDQAKAEKAGLWGKGNWAKYPAAMLRARAITEVARSAASEALFGVIYTPEELGAEVAEDGTPIITDAPAPPARPRQATARPLHVVSDQGPAAPAAPAETEEQKTAADAEWLGKIDGLSTVEAARALYAEAKTAGQLTRPLQVQDATAEVHQWIALRVETIKGHPAPGHGHDHAEATAPPEAQGGSGTASPAAEGGPSDPLTRAEATVRAAGLGEPIEGEIIDPRPVPEPQRDPEDLCRSTAQRKAVLAQFTELYGGAEVSDAALEQHFGVELQYVSTKRLREHLTDEQRKNLHQ